MSAIAEVRLWGRSIGAVSWIEERGYAAFEYDVDFSRSGIQVAPFMMPLPDSSSRLVQKVYSFAELSRETFNGLPGMLADSLPDKFGNALIDVWLAKQGRKPVSFNPVERLCYIGARGMGALEFVPKIGPSASESESIVIAELVGLASSILNERQQLAVSVSTADIHSGLQDILRVGTSAGGARAKAVIAWNPETNEVRSGQVDVDQGFEYWLLKFDGVSGNSDKEFNDPTGYGAIEYAYYLMARAAGINMSESRLLEENGRRHFMTRRFDRISVNGKLEKRHMQTLGALCHYDFNLAGAYSYEQAMQVIRRIGLPMMSVEQQFRRMAFNIIARNQDDHVKNIAFLMDKRGQWTLSPAYDMTYNYNPVGAWTGQHQMSMNGKRDDFSLQDFIDCGSAISLQRGRAKSIVQEVAEVVRHWPDFAQQAGIDEQWCARIGASHRLAMAD